ncbi:RNA polymerase sigma factor [Micromonospora sp. NPDC003944]
MESSLRARVRAGDPGAFAELFDTYARSVYNHAFRLTADWATAEDVMAATYLQAWRSRERVTALPSPDASGPAARPAPPGPAAKNRGYGTVRHLTDSADLVVRGEVASVADGRAVYRVAEVLYRAPEARVSTQITVAAEVAGSAGQPSVLYLGLADPATGVYRPLGGDVGIFDLAGETATSRSPAMSVTGLRTEDATGTGRAFVTTLAELRRLADERR